MPTRSKRAPLPAGGVVLQDGEQALVLDKRCECPPGIAHGGYVAGLLAAGLGGRGARVRLRRPVPIDRGLTLARRSTEVVELLEDETVLVEAESASVSVELPAPVSLAEATSASRRFLGFNHHPVPHCMVCGTARRAGDGLRIFPGPVAGRRLVATPWAPPVESAADGGAVPVELVSAAFACAQLWALIAHSSPRTPELVVTGELELSLLRPVRARLLHVLTGWPIRREGRIWQAGAALFDCDGALCAVGLQKAVITDWGIPLGTPPAT